MHRAAVKAFRTARLTGLRTRTGPLPPSSYVLGSRHASGPGPTSNPGTTPSKEASLMYIRRVSVALLSGLVGYGAWYTYKGQTGDLVPGGQSSPTQAQQARGLSTSPTYSFPQAAQTAEEVERKAVIFGPDSLYTSPVPGNEPISKDTDDAGRKVLEMLTPEQATQKLRRNEESYLIGRGKGVVRYDVVQIPSNDPIEDDHSEKIIELPEALATATAARNPASDWMFWGVFDGHSGWTTSAKLRQVLINFVARELNSTYKAALADPALGSPSSESIESAIKTGFNRLDHEIVHESVEKVLKANSKLVAAELLAPALSGSCALLSFYDSNSKLLRVACTGDSRAVLGRLSENGKWTASALSVDQTGGNPDEEARMRKLHPGEDNVIRNGRVLGGLEPTRAFGDASYKWTREVSERLKRSFFARTPSQHLRSPPYVTAEPVVTTTKIEPEKGDFVVMATDGLWEMLTNEEVVGLVGQWIEKQSAEANGNSANSWIKMFSSQEKGLPIEQGAKDAKGKARDGQKTPIRQQQWGVKGGENERFVVQDKNVATHLVRNALGGKDKDMVCALLTLPAPFSRRYRDDLTVEVIFFGNSDKSGNVVVNKEASASAKDIKAKL
ncbi:[Pyruvate dehydrogenase [acetyl-transferring]]-phosphatase 1, mitochondrial [Lachnellula willkommii]|uniref:[Pyruvate dehydrogenase [acetyl-transferring]]-phosphatase 1, mitochondrial n=1 Tax=Lachnellula willkommii TaxID=215461 RepID=A0A559MM51_9HELO|nr:[Pyruvate dehydrogenase [acetyl-transferring]]-phosphatase 1, mitochondrial [Lachnellula willkommii]